MSKATYTHRDVITNNQYDLCSRNTKDICVKNIFKAIS